MKLTDKTKQILLLMVLFIIAVKFWNTMFIYPIKVFVVILHEMSHGMMALALGGRIVEIQISPNIGGACAYTIPNSKAAQVLVSSAGYIGSMVWGALILVASFRVKKNKHITMIIGLFTLILSIFVSKTGEIFGIVFCLGFTLFMIFSYKYLADWFHDYMVKFLGLTSCLYVILDITNDLILQTGLGSDADQIGAIIGIPSILIGILCIVVSSYILFISLRFCFGGKRRIYKHNGKSSKLFD